MRDVILSLTFISVIYVYIEGMEDRADWLYNATYSSPGA